MAQSATLFSTNCSSTTGQKDCLGTVERPNHPDSSCPLALTDDLLAMLDQHFLDDGPELLDGSDGLQKKKKRVKVLVRRTPRGPARHEDTHQVATLCQLRMHAALQRQTCAQTRLPA